jgi:hypothetical protein
MRTLIAATALLAARRGAGFALPPTFPWPTRLGAKDLV